LIFQSTEVTLMSVVSLYKFHNYFYTKIIRLCLHSHCVYIYSTVGVFSQTDIGGNLIQTSTSKKGIMKILKQSCIYALLIILILWTNNCYCQSSTTDTSYGKTPLDWTKITYKLISFKYPSNWFYEKEMVGNQTRLSVTPDAVKDIKNLRAIEIFDVDISKWTFEKFKSDSCKKRNETDKKS